MATTTASTAATGKKKSGSWLVLALATPVALMLLPSTLVLIPAMIPTFVARFVDPGPGRHLSITVGSMNFAGSLLFMHELWSAGQTFSAVLPTLGNLLGWLSALMGAGCGWAIYWVIPLVARQLAATKASMRLTRVRRYQADLIERWGEKVRGADVQSPEKSAHAE